MTNFKAILQALHDAGVEFVVVGAYAAVLHGFAGVTQDLDICYDRAPENLKRLATAFKPFHPKLRGAPSGLPFNLDPETLKRGLNFTLATDIGDVDLLGELDGVGQFPGASKGAESITVFDVACRIASLDVIIRSKRAAGRPKDLSVLPELHALEELKNPGKGRKNNKK